MENEKVRSLFFWTVLVGSWGDRIFLWFYLEYMAKFIARVVKVDFANFVHVQGEIVDL